jgi:DNA polymerase III psi subunit
LLYNPAASSEVTNWLQLSVLTFEIGFSHVANKTIRLKWETVIATDILQSFNMSLEIIAVITTIKILMSARHAKVVVDVTPDPL